MSWFNIAKASLLNQVIPTHSKRLLFMIALYQIYSANHNLTDEELERLNAAMSLATKTDAKALRFPCLVMKGFKFGIDKSVANLTSEDFATIADNIPCWLRYARKEDLCSDIEKLYKYATVV